MKLKIATWNLQLPVTPRRRELLRRHTLLEKAELWVLTETHDSFSPDDNYSVVSSAAGRDGSDKPGHRWVSIWSKHSLEQLATRDGQRTAAARVSPAEGDPYIVFGTVLPWIGSKWQDHPSAGGVAFREALAVQVDDWMRLTKEFPNDEFFLLGDFNQDLVSGSPRYYGSRANRIALEDALKRAGLNVLTGGKNDPIRTEIKDCACIDHICMRQDSAWRLDVTTRWPKGDRPQKGLSDHFGVAANLYRK